MSSTVQHLSMPATARTAESSADASAISRRGQGWLIVFAASVVLWSGIIVAIVGIAGLAQ